MGGVCDGSTKMKIGFLILHRLINSEKSDLRFRMFRKAVLLQDSRSMNFEWRERYTS